MFQRSPSIAEIIPARHGRAFRVRAGHTITVVDVEGGQVGDVFAFAADDLSEAHSASHTRASTGRLFPRPGSDFSTTLRRPILRLVSDTSPGVHDMLIAACDQPRYAALGHPDHPSCAANLESALGKLGLAVPGVPQPINVFMNVPSQPDGTLRLLPSPSRAGDAITFQAVIDCVVVVSACPQDLTPINGGHPTALAVEIRDSSAFDDRE